MKTSILLTFAILLLLLSANVSSQKIANTDPNLQNESATILSSPDLYQLTSKWVDEYKSFYPERNINVIIAPKPGLVSYENLCFVTNTSSVVIADEKNWKMVVGRSIIVPVMNSENPYLNEILKQGISAGKFAQIIDTPDKQNWGSLINSRQNEPVHIYMVNDESVKTCMAKFLQLAQVPVNGITIGTKEEVIDAIQKDPLSIGFCNLVNIMVPGNQNLVNKVRLLPIDKNGNGRIDYMEDIYSDANTFLRGVWIGKYPKAMFSNVYAVSKMQPANESELAFLSWVISDGQQYMNSAGYCELAGSESQSQLERFNSALITIYPAREASQTGIIFLVLAGICVLGFVISFGIRRYRKQGNIVPDFDEQPQSFNEESVVLPQGLYFDNTHTWAFMEKDGNISIGIDDFLQHITGPITRVEMKKQGEKIKKGDLLFTIVQSGKQLNLYSPVSGTIKKQNEALKTNSSFINSSPYSEGWVYMIEPSNWFKEIQFMDMAEKHKKWIDNEFSRVKDFLAATLQPKSLEYSHIVFQDGGVLKNGVLTDFGPEVWENFQTNFLDNYK